MPHFSLICRSLFKMCRELDKGKIYGESRIWNNELELENMNEPRPKVLVFVLFGVRIVLWSGRAGSQETRATSGVVNRLLRVRAWSAVLSCRCGRRRLVVVRWGRERRGCWLGAVILEFGERSAEESGAPSFTGAVFLV